MLTPKQRLKIAAACVFLAFLAGIFSAATSNSADSLSRSDRTAIDSYNKLTESCHAGQGGCRAAEAQRQKFHEEGICMAANEEHDKVAHGGFYRCAPR